MRRSRRAGSGGFTTFCVAVASADDEIEVGGGAAFKREQLRRMSAGGGDAAPRRHPPAVKRPQQDRSFQEPPDSFVSLMSTDDLPKSAATPKANSGASAPGMHPPGAITRTGLVVLDSLAIMPDPV